VPEWALVVAPEGGALAVCAFAVPLCAARADYAPTSAMAAFMKSRRSTPSFGSLCMVKDPHVVNGNLPVPLLT
jgi:hypothetical protein